MCGETGVGANGLNSLTVRKLTPQEEKSQQEETKALLLHALFYLINYVILII